MKDKRGMELEVLGWWILGIAILVLVVIGYMYFNQQGTKNLDFIKNIFRFGS